MASVADLVDPRALEALAKPDARRTGAALANGGAVRITAFGPQDVVAVVASPEGDAHVELRGGNVLTFECSCETGRTGAFCAHLVAAATEIQRRSPGRRGAASPTPTGEPPATTATGRPPAAASAPAPTVKPPPRGRSRRSTGRPLKVGVQLPEVEREVRWPELRDMARAAEDVGFDSLWLGDHLLYRRPNDRARGPWEVWTSLAGLAEATDRIALGPLVACTGFHNPTMLAKLAATVDEISGGRLIVGLGAGWNETEFQAFGFPFGRRIARFEEAFTIIRTLLREGAIDFAGTYYEARDCELLPRPRPGGPPLMVGSSGPRMLHITLPHVDAWNVWYDATDNDPSGVAPLREQVDAICREVGREPSAVERTVAVLVRLPGGVGRVHGDVGAPPIAPLQGEPDRIAEGLRAYAREGIGHVQLVLDPITRESIQAMAPVLKVLDAG